MTAPVDAFARLQGRLRPVEHRDDPRQTDRRVIVGLPSLNFDQSVIEAHADAVPAMEERYLYLLFGLRRPLIHVICVTSLPVPAEILAHHLSLIPDAPDAEDRLLMLSVEDDSPRPLAQKLLERPDLLRQIASWAGGVHNDGLILPFNVRDAERDVALSVGLPLYGADHRFMRFAMKSGGRQLFAESGVSHPEGFEDLRDVDAVALAIRRLRERRPDVRRVVAKHDDGVYGEGNAIVAVGDLPPAGSAREEAALAVRLNSLPPEWRAGMNALGGIVEEMIEADEIRSPSVQMRILPGGDPVVVSTHDQVLGGPLGQTFSGCRFPADPQYAGLIVSEARKVGEHLASAGVIGRFGIDFVVARDGDGPWRSFAVEINLREGGTSHPYGSLWLLTDGRLSDDGSEYRTRRGEPRHLFATDVLQDPAYSSVRLPDFLEAAKPLVYDPETQLGIVFHMLRELERAGRISVTAVGESAEDANARYLAVVELLDRLAK